MKIIDDTKIPFCIYTVLEQNVADLRKNNRYFSFVISILYQKLIRLKISLNY